MALGARRRRRMWRDPLPGIVRLLAGLWGLDERLRREL